VPLRLSIVTPMRPLVEADVEQVVAPGSEGEFGVLPGHSALLVALRPGVVRWVEAGRARRAAISGGLAEVTQERVTVLAPMAERSIDTGGRSAALPHGVHRGA
jgi:F-type H+-transporting ATPase subunit epsilon